MKLVSSIFILLSMALYASASLTADICAERPDVPCLRVPACSTKQKATISSFKISTASYDVNSKHPISISICYENSGFRISEVAQETILKNPHSTCNAHVWEGSSVVEIFLTPVTDVRSDPKWYWEIDTTPSGATYSAAIFNQNGSANNCPKCVAEELKCSGKNSFPDYPKMSFNTHIIGNKWINDVFIPWNVFRNFSASTRVFRGNFYRYSYDTSTSYELSAWSPTYGKSFHVPSRFGILVLE